MLRIHFGHADLARTRFISGPDPLWEIAMSLQRFQTRRGRWAYAHWYRTARHRLQDKGLGRTLRTVLLPMFPKGVYFPDFLTPAESGGGLDAGLEAILATPPRQVLSEVAILDRTVGAPSWAPRLAEQTARREFAGILKAYYEAVIAPYQDEVQARVEAERTVRGRDLLDGGTEGMLSRLGPTMRWSSPVLHLDYPAEDRDLYLDGRGLTLAPSYFSWNNPISLASPDLPPVVCYPVCYEPPASAAGPEYADLSGTASLTGLLGRARAAALVAAAFGATTGEIARAAGVSASSASRHATALRDAGLVTSSRNGANVLHCLTPAGAAVLRAATRAARGGGGLRIPS
ncbi:ArsR family transcriptional regulator [Streptomyces sp. SCSIO-PteL053]|nr:ArsR family transcriptional regulator [Streptomyces sp. SCSIO-PteL053]